VKPGKNARNCSPPTLSGLGSFDWGGRATGDRVVNHKAYHRLYLFAGLDHVEATSGDRAELVERLKEQSVQRGLCRVEGPGKVQTYVPIGHERLAEKGFVFAVPGLVRCESDGIHRWSEHYCACRWRSEMDSFDADAASTARSKSEEARPVWVEGHAY
jgi:hypothetical protein